MKLYLLYCGKLDLPASRETSRRCPVKTADQRACWAYLVEHEKGLVLIDCGQHNTAVARCGKRTEL